MATAEQIKLTKGQRAFFEAVACGERMVFHRRVIEPVEDMDLVLFVGGFRLVGCNGFGSGQFMLTADGKALADTMFVQAAA